jgi:polysaccharide export outer membrane protein
VLDHDKNGQCNALGNLHRRSGGSGLRAAVSVSMVAGTLLTVAGCRDSFMDPSVLGRWEQTPAIVPVLDRIATIEDDDSQAIEYSAPLPEDLLPQPNVYVLTPGDTLEITLYDLILTDKAESYKVLVDAKGMIDLPQLGRIMVGGRTVERAVADIQQLMTKLVTNPLAQMTVLDQRGSTYSIVGNIERAGTYSIPNSNFHLLEAITSGGRFEENVSNVYVIRRIPLDSSGDLNPGGDSTSGSISPAANPGFSDPFKTPAGSSGDGKSRPSGDDLLKLIDDVAPKKPGSPGMIGDEPPATTKAAPKAAAKPAAKLDAAEPAIDLPGDDSAKKGSAKSNAAGPNKSAPAPAVDLIESNSPAKQASAAAKSESSATQWIFVNGKWTQVTRTGAAPATGQASTPGAKPAQYMTQRVIRIPTLELLSGQHPMYNIVIRPGDVIRVPAPPAGLVYMAGQVARPGPISLPQTGGLTLLRALDAAGGLGEKAIPERIDLTRMIGHDRQATIMLDGRSIAEHTQPDVYVKANDRINVGTNFWALPLAVVRNGFRANYGYGFIIDRNFGNDIFGPPPDRRTVN